MLLMYKRFQNIKISVTLQNMTSFYVKTTGSLRRLKLKRKKKLSSFPTDFFFYYL